MDEKKTFECCVSALDLEIEFESTRPFSCTHNNEKLCVKCSDLLVCCPLCRNPKRGHELVRDNWSEALKRNGRLLEKMPIEMKTVEFCLLAVSQSPSALEFVPDTLKTHSLCLHALNLVAGWSYNEIHILKFIPERIITEDFFSSAAKKSNSILELVPTEMKTLEVCLASVSRCGGTLQYVPVRMKTLEVCLVAVTKWGNALEYVPTGMKTLEVCLAAVSTWGGALEYVPEGMKTLQVCLAAVSAARGRALKYFPVEMKTHEVCLAAVSVEGDLLQYVPEGLKSSKVCWKALSKDKNSHYYVPKKMSDYLEQRAIITIVRPSIEVHDFKY